MTLSVFERRIRFVIARTLLEHGKRSPDEHVLTEVRENLMLGLSVDQGTFNKMICVFPRDRQIAVQYTFCKARYLACSDESIVRFIPADLRVCEAPHGRS